MGKSGERSGGRPRGSWKNSCSRSNSSRSLVRMCATPAFPLLLLALVRSGVTQGKAGDDGLLIQTPSVTHISVFTRSFLSLSPSLSLSRLFHFYTFPNLFCYGLFMWRCCGFEWMPSACCGVNHVFLNCNHCRAQTATGG